MESCSNNAYRNCSFCGAFPLWKSPCFVQTLFPLPARASTLCPMFACPRKYSNISTGCSSTARVQKDSPNFFQSAALNRHGNTSATSQVVEVLENANDSDFFLPIWNGKVIVSTKNSPAGDVSVVKWNKKRAFEWLMQHRKANTDAPVVASLVNDIKCRYYALNVSSDFPPVDSGEQVKSLRNVLAAVSSEKDLALACHAKVLISWHEDNLFCGRCGSRSVVVKGGRARSCTTCASGNIYPRVEPSVLVLVLRNGGEECLLGRKASWTHSRYSVIAGFCDIFESLEETVIREVFEETGVHVNANTISYISSQPWPSPKNSLMSAFRAEATDGGAICVDQREIEDARWFGRNWLKEELAKPACQASVSIPGKASLSHRLIMDWINEGADEREKGPCGC